MSAPKPNPVVKTIELLQYPGWTARQYADGMFDATHTDGALTPGFVSLGEVYAFVATEVGA